MKMSLLVEYFEKQIDPDPVKCRRSRKAECERRCPNVTGDTRTSAETADLKSFFRDPVDGGCPFAIPTRPVGLKINSTECVRTLPILLGYTHTMYYQACRRHNIAGLHSCSRPHNSVVPPQNLALKLKYSLCCARIHGGSHHHHIIEVFIRKTWFSPGKHCF